MRLFRLFAVFVILLLLALACPKTPAQSTTPAPAPAISPSYTFSMQASAVALPGNHQTVAGSLTVPVFYLTDRLALRNDNLLAPASDLQGYFGGIQYDFPLDSLLSKTKLPKNTFSLYITGSAGIDRIVPAQGQEHQHYAFLFGGGVHYDPTGTGHFGLSLIEVRYAKLPGYANNTAIIGSGVKLSF